MKDEDIRKYKQVILIRSDVKMDCGKKCVQVAHASIMGHELIAGSAVAENWQRNGMRKIVLKVKDLVDLESIVFYANREGIRSATIIDAGLTQLEPNTITCIGFQPLAEDNEKCIILNQLTKDLKLL